MAALALAILWKPEKSSLNPMDEGRASVADGADDGLADGAVDGVAAGAVADGADDGLAGAVVELDEAEFVSRSGF